MKGKRMKHKFDYEKAKIDVISFEETDVITTSDGSIETGSDNMTNEGWTPVEW